MGRPRKWGRFPQTGTVEELLDMGKSGIEELYEEVYEWRSGMEGTGLESTDKYSILEETEQGLETAKDALSYIEDLNELPFAKTKIEYSEHKKRGYPRWVRLENAINQLMAVSDHYAEIRETWEKEGSSDKLDRLAEVHDCVQEAIDCAEIVEFPGMFG